MILIRKSTSGAKNGYTFVHSYTLATGFYGLAVDGFNPVIGHCKMASYPIDCETSDEVECERGPATYGISKAVALRVIPLCLYLVIPTITMILIHSKIKSRETNPTPQTKVLITSKEVTTQACVYLAPMYILTLPFFISVALEYFHKVDDESLLPVTLVGRFLFALLGLWSMFIYWYFSTDLTPSKQQEGTSTQNNLTESKRGATQLIFNSDANRRTAARPDSPTTDVEQNGDEEPKTERRYSFNIFDGTNAGGAFADFIHDGDSEDERMDQQETDRWKAIQNHI